MLIAIKVFFLFLLFPISLFSECYPTINYMAQEWKAVNATSTVDIADHWYYTASGTVNVGYAFSHDDNFFEVKTLFDRVLKPMHEMRPGGKIVYGPDWYGLETKMTRFICPETSSQTAIIDPWEGYCNCSERHYFYTVVGSSTILHLKNGVLPVKEIK